MEEFSTWKELKPQTPLRCVAGSGVTIYISLARYRFDYNKQYFINSWHRHSAQGGMWTYPYICKWWKYWLPFEKGYLLPPYYRLPPEQRGLLGSDPGFVFGFLAILTVSTIRSRIISLTSQQISGPQPLFPGNMSKVEISCSWLPKWKHDGDSLSFSMHKHGQSLPA